jgi:hypothetical protein
VIVCKLTIERRFFYWFVLANIQVDEFINQLIAHTEEFRKQQEIDVQEEVLRLFTVLLLYNDSDSA